MSKIEKLLGVMARLRDPQSGCPWDLEQDFQSLVPHTLEEAYEVAETIEQGTLEELPQELGDLLFQVVFYARLGEELGRFDFNTVVEGIVEKLTRRHPHVFGDAEVADAAAQSLAWETHKAEERRHDSSHEGVLGGVARSLPALTRAVKLQKRAARVGFDWPNIRPIFDKVLEELEEVRLEVEQLNHRSRIQEEIGDLMFACTNLARHLQIDPETALRSANRKFERRFSQMEAKADASGRTLTSLDAGTWNEFWEAVKAEEDPAD